MQPIDIESELTTVGFIIVICGTFYLLGDLLFKKSADKLTELYREKFINKYYTNKNMAVKTKLQENLQVVEETPTKLEQLYNLAKDAIEKIKIPFEVRKAKKDLEKEIITIEQEIAEKEQAINDAKCTRPFNLTTILDAIDDKEILERKLIQANELLIELF